jgi:hypothetical protein
MTFGKNFSQRTSNNKATDIAGGNQDLPYFRETACPTPGTFGPEKKSSSGISSVYF